MYASEHASQSKIQLWKNDFKFVEYEGEAIEIFDKRFKRII